jgi:hypothetical protein
MANISDQTVSYLSRYHIERLLDAWCMGQGINPSEVEYNWALGDDLQTPVGVAVSWPETEDSRQ